MFWRVKTLPECTFCFICGRLADEAKNCTNTNCSFYGKPANPGLDRYLERGQLKDKDWLKYYCKPHNDYVYQFYACDNCRFIMHHRLNYCPKCGGYFVSQEMKYSEMKEKYGEYREGY